MESTLLPAAERLWHRRQEDVSCIFSSHSAMMLCDRSQRSAPPQPPSPPRRRSRRRDHEAGRPELHDPRGTESAL